MQQLRGKLKMELIPSFVLNCMKTQNHNVEIDFSKLDPVLFSTLLPFQIDGLQWVINLKWFAVNWGFNFSRFGIDKNGRCLIGDDMGLGKTFQALALANYYMEDWPVLIVTTATMK